MFALHPSSRSRPAGLALTTVMLSGLAACGGKDGGTTEPALPPVVSGPTLNVIDTAAAPQKVLQIRLRSTSNNRDTLTVRIGTVATIAVRINDSTLAFSVPHDMPAGRYALSLPSANISGDSLVVTAAVPIASPIAYVQSAVDAALAKVRATAALPNATATDTARLKAMQTTFDDVMSRTRAATIPEQVAIARLLATNARVLGLPVLDGVSAAVAISPSILQLAQVSSCTEVREMGFNPSTYTENGEYCAERMPGVFATSRDAIVQLFVFTTFAFVGSRLTGPVGIIAGSIAAAFAVNEAFNVKQDLARRSSLPQPKQVLAQNDALTQLVGSATSAVNVQVMAAARPVFEDSTPKAFAVRMRYDSPTAADVSLNSYLATSSGTLNGLAIVWNSTAAIIPGLPAAPALPSTPAISAVGVVAAKYLELGTISPSTVRGIASNDDGAWTLKFSSSVPLTDTISVTFTARYVWNGFVAPQSQQFTVRLAPRPTLPVARVTMSPSGGRIGVRDSLTLVGTAYDSLNRVLPKQKITGRSSVAGTASVDTAGVVRGIAEGITTITATALTPAGEAKIAQAEVIVSPMPVATVAITPASPSVIVNDSIRLTATLRDSLGNILTGRIVTWSSASTSFATIGSATGTAHGRNEGTSTITATSEGKSGSATLRVTLNPVVGTYALTTLNGIMVPGVTYRDSLYRVETSGGGVTLSADLTFTFGITARGHNARNAETFDEGGSASGTYTVNNDGAGIAFTILVRSGKIVRELGNASIIGKRMTVTVRTDDGSGTGVLVRP